MVETLLPPLPLLPAAMPYSVRLEPAARLARIHVTGTLTGEEIASACRETFTHPQWERGFSTLWDARDMRALLLLLEDVAAFAEEVEDVLHLRGPGRTAFVTWDPAVRINAMLLGLKSNVGDGGRESRVFGHIEEAEAWLSAGGEQEE
jgi:hypothetical protein